MKNTLKIALGAALGAAMFAGGAAAAPEVEGGDQLVTTCRDCLRVVRHLGPRVSRARTS